MWGRACGAARSASIARVPAPFIGRFDWVTIHPARRYHRARMPDRIVVCFRGVANVEEDGGQSYLDRAIAIKEQCERRGATLCAWSAQTFSFDLPTTELEAAVELAVECVERVERVTRAGSGDESFRAGIAQGPMDAVVEAAAPEVLSWGAPLLHAVGLARIARPGEVLLDPKIVAARPGELLLLGMRVAFDAGDRGKKVRGARLDTRNPWRKLAAKSVALMREPELVGRDELTDLVVPLGCIGVIRADPGAGGTRLLHEAIRRLDPGRVLLVTPVGASREPLGAVRRALSRSAVLHGAPALPEHLRDALDRLLAGEGTDRWSAAEIIDAWLSPEQGRFGVLAVDDVGEIDLVSLEAIASSLSVRDAFRALVRLDGSDGPMPAPLRTAAIGPVISAGLVDKAAAERVARAFAGGVAAPEAAKRWARRGGGSPLGIREALAEGFTTGELCFFDAVATPRRRSSGRGRVGTPRQWIERRMAYLTDGERTALTALAMLGGDASETMIDALAVGMGGPSAHSAVVVEALLAGGWVARPEPGWLKLTSRTARDALLGGLSEGARRSWHLAASGMLRHYGGLLGHADAAWYASEAGDLATAAELALDAARAAEAARLEAAADGLRELAGSLSSSITPASLPDDVRLHLMSLFPPSSITPRPMGAGADLRDGGPTDAPPSSDALDLTLDEALTRDREPASLDLDLDDIIEQEAKEAVPEHRARPGPRPAPPPPPPPLPEAKAPMQLAERAKRALVQGDLVTLEKLIGELRRTGEHLDLVERMSGFVALGRGAKAEALRKLRAAADIEQPPAQRARALLAYGVALAATGEPEAALLEALDALARAREVGDRHGEEACARFLARLSSAAGHPTAAEAWADVAKQVSGAPRG